MNYIEKIYLANTCNDEREMELTRFNQAVQDVIDYRICKNCKYFNHNDLCINFDNRPLVSFDETCENWEDKNG